MTPRISDVGPLDRDVSIGTHDRWQTARAPVHRRQSCLVNKAALVLFAIALTVVTVLGLPVFIVNVAGQQPPQRAASARDAFPVPSEVQVTRDIVYARYGDRQLKLDVYVPRSGRQRGVVPGVVVVRGGGWRAGDKEAFGFIAGRLAKDGFVAASVEYRTSREAKFPAAVHDIKAAVRWMRAQAATYRVDPDAIGALGASAGGHLVAMLATTAGVKNLEGAGGNPSSASQVQAAVAMACVCDLDLKSEIIVNSTLVPTINDFIGSSSPEPDALRAASPVNYVDNHSAPLLLLHSRTDPVVPFGLSAQMESVYRRVGAMARLEALDAPDTHAFWNETRYFPQMMRLATEFLRTNLMRSKKN